jgi:hypothetical protein
MALMAQNYQYNEKVVLTHRKRFIKRLLAMNYAIQP